MQQSTVRVSRAWAEERCSYVCVCLPTDRDVMSSTYFFGVVWVTSAMRYAYRGT